MKPYWKIAFKNYKGGWFYGRKKYPSLEDAQEAAYKHNNWKRIDRFPFSKTHIAILKRLKAIERNNKRIVRRASKICRG